MGVLQKFDSLYFCAMNKKKKCYYMTTNTEKRNLTKGRNQMKIFFILLAINLFTFASFAHWNNGAITFSLKKLEDIASLLPEKYLVDHDTIMPFADICESKSFVIQYNAKHQVSHLGISMFSKEIKAMMNVPVCNFVERFLLELALAENEQEANAKLSHYGILIQRNGIKFGEANVKSIVDILNEIADPVSFSLTKDDKTYTAAWKYGLQNLFTIQFPINRELITGTNKIEADNDLFDQLKDTNCKNPLADPVRPFNDADLVSDDGKVFIKKGDSFVLGRINENTYYKKTPKGYELIFDEKYPTESLANLFLGNIEKDNLKIHVTHSMYGNYNPEFEMKLNDFICFFKQDFNIYAATYQKRSGQLNATVIFQNKLYNYIHLLVISVKQETIFSGNGVLVASFRSNIPQHNINSVISDFMNSSSNDK